MPTTVFSIATGADDSEGNSSEVTWPTQGHNYTSDDGLNQLSCSKTTGFGQEDPYMRWNTSSLAGSVIVSAVLKIHIIGTPTNPDGYSLSGRWYDFGGAPCVAADWQETASPNILGSVSLSSFTADAVNTFTITDVSGISQSGFSGIHLTLSAGTPTSASFFDCASFENATLQEPRLEVTWNPAASPLRGEYPARKFGPF